MKIPLFIRRGAKRISRNIVIRRRLPARFGSRRLVVSPGAWLICRRGLGLPAFNDLHDCAENYVHPGDVVWDVGGNIGHFSSTCAARAGITGRVICFGPDPWSVRLLKRSSQHNHGHAAPINVLPVAIGDRLSLEWLHVPGRSRAASHLGSNGAGGGADITGTVRERHLTSVLTLGWLSQTLPAPKVLKIDVVGGERRALRGGETMLRKNKPVILVEVHGRNADEVTSFLLGFGGLLYQCEKGESGKNPVSHSTYNTLGLPSPA